MKVDLMYAERQLRYWTRKAAELRLTFDASDAKEGEKGKEEKSPTPPKGEKGKGEEKQQPPQPRGRARGSRGVVCSRVVPEVEEIAAECARIGSDIDPKFFWNYYKANTKGWPPDWKAALAVWTDNGKPSGRIRKPSEEPVETPPHVYALEDWALCAERCAKLKDDKCAAGMTVPPDKDPGRRKPPEECGHYVPGVRG